VLIIHAREDALIPAYRALRLYAHAHQPKQLWLADTCGHGSALFQAEEAYLQTVIRWDRRELATDAHR
jgi:pimeloyl-ACP methyl ester carboxylesterase